MFQQVSVAETIHTRSFQIDSACWNYLESPSFSRRKPSGIWDTLGFRIAETCWNLEFQDWNYADTIRILKFQHSFSDVSAMLKRYFSSSDRSDRVKEPHLLKYLFISQKTIPINRNQAVVLFCSPYQDVKELETNWFQIECVIIH